MRRLAQTLLQFGIQECYLADVDLRACQLCDRVSL